MSARSLIRSFLALSFGNVVSQLLMLVAFAAIGRGLGPEEFGWWSFSYVCTLYLFRLNEFGLEVMGVRAIASGRSPALERISSVLGTRIILAIFLFLAAMLACVLGIVPREARLLIIIFAIAVFPVALTIEWAYEAAEQFHLVSVARIAKAVLFVGFVLLATGKASMSLSTAIMYSVSMAVPGIYLLVDSRRRFGPLKIEFHWSQSKALLKESIPVGVTSLLLQYSLFLATTFLGYFASASELGLFSAAQRLIVFVWAYGIVASNRVVLPTLSRLHRESAEAFDQFVVRATRLLLIVALPIGILGSVASNDIVELVYGHSFSAAGPTFRVLLWILVMAISRSAVEISYWASDQQWTYVRRMLVLATAHTIAVPIGFFVNGVPGVVVGMLIAESVYTMLLMLRARIAWPRSMTMTVARVLFASAIAYLVSMVGSLPTLPTIVIGGLIYGATLILTGELTRQDRAKVLALFNAKVM